MPSIERFAHMVFGKYDEGSRIVHSYSGSGTVDTIYVTEDGTHWLHSPAPIDSSQQTAGPRIGKIVGDRIYG